MEKLFLKSFERLGIEKKQGLDCFDMPIAYGTTVYADDYYFCYFLLILIEHCWSQKKTPKMQSKEKALNFLGLEFSCSTAATKKDFLNNVYESINNGNPIFIILDYFNIFYEPKFYQWQHNLHGAIISGYDKSHKRLILQENAHMDFIGMFQLYLTNDMVYQMWKKTAIYLNDNDGKASGELYSIIKRDNCSPKSLLETFEFFITQISTCENALISTISENSFSFINNIKDQTSFRKHEYIAIEVLFDIILILIKRNALNEHVKEYEVLRKEYLEQRNVVVMRILKNAIISAKFTPNEIEKYKNATIELDRKLVKYSQKIISKIKGK